MPVSSEKSNELTYNIKVKESSNILPKLPLELWGLIFRWTLPAAFYSASRRDHMRATLLPGWICRYWRHLSSATPQLWLYLDLALRQLDRDAEIFGLWSQNSRTLPLFLRLGVQGPSNDALRLQPDMIGHALFASIIAESFRWKTIHLGSRLPSGFIRDCLAHRDLPLVETIYIQNRAEHPSESEEAELKPPNSIVLGHAPRLYHLETCISCVVLAPSSQLRDMAFGSRSSTVSECLKVLRHDTGVKCFLWLEATTNQDLSGHPMITLPKLHTFNIRTTVDPSLLFDHLSMPCLRSFQYSDMNNTFDCRQSFLSVITRCPCLQKLQIHTCTVDLSDVLVDALKSTPNLEDLGWSGRTFTWLEVLSLSNRPILLPKLVSLRLNFIESFELPAFVELVRSRWRLTDVDLEVDQHNQITRLQFVQLRFLRTAQEELARRSQEDMNAWAILREMETEGLRVSVAYWGVPREL